MEFHSASTCIKLILMRKLKKMTEIWKLSTNVRKPITFFPGFWKNDGMWWHECYMGRALYDIGIILSATGNMRVRKRTF